MPKNLLLIFLFCTFSRFARAQQGSGKTVPVFFEKAYLHTDRDFYGQGEDIWFKAYLVNAENNRAINYSHNLYVELIDPTTKILYRRVIRLEKGLGNGDFKLSDSIASGTYRLRAYTNWMRNFGDNFIFEKNIRILNTRQPVPATAAVIEKNRKNRAVTTIVVKDTLPVVRFFPEGGSMVAGVSSVVAVKAEDAVGRGIAMKGKIISGTGATVSNFSCDSLGFGSFTIKPGAGQHYQAQVSILGQQQVFPLPAISASGFNLALSHITDTLIASVSCNTQMFAQSKGQHLYLTATHGGKTYVSKVMAINSAVNTLKMPDSWFPEGIACVTITDENTQPLAERLVYVHHAHGVKLNISTDKKAYRTSETVNVGIKLNTRAKTNLSLAVVDAGAVPVQEGNILSYLNLQSEIKGHIENPGRYFDTTNVNRFKQLDMLLLTQGWRDFIWKHIADTTLKLAYQPEQGIDITGKVRKVWTKGALSNINITMRAPKAEGQKLFWTTTDSTGHFIIYDTQFYGYQYINFTARRGKINRDGEAKSGGWLQVDSLFKDTLAVKPLTKKVADTAWLANREADAMIAKITQALKLKADHNLKEVTIQSNKQNRTMPVQVIKITSAEQKEYDNLAQYLIERIPWAKAVYRGCLYCDSPFPMRPYAMFLDRTSVHGVYADKSPIDYCHLCEEDYLMQPMRNILQVTIRGVNSWGGWSAAVEVILRPGALDPNFDNTMADMVGYYRAREFYKPNPEDPAEASDQRINTVYWEPNITTDENGEAVVHFPNTPKPGNLRLIVEGITDKGDVVAGVMGYKVN